MITNGSYNCAKYDKTVITKDQIKDRLNQGYVGIIQVYGRNKGGKSSFTSVQHYMALIDYSDNEFFVENAYSNSAHGKYGWYNADEVLESYQNITLCSPTNEFINKFN